MKNDLQLIVKEFITDNKGIVRVWREKVGEKYSNLRDLNDFLTVTVPLNKMVVKVCEKFYSGMLHDSPAKLKKGFLDTDSCIPKVTDSSKQKGILDL